jgi:hypothetical protein
MELEGAHSARLHRCSGTAGAQAEHKHRDVSVACGGVRPLER